MRALFLLSILGFAAAENGLDAWLRYGRLPHHRSYTRNVPDRIVTLSSEDANPVYSAGVELQRGFNGIFDKDLKVSEKLGGGSAVVVGTVEKYTKAGGKARIPRLEEDGYWLSISGRDVLILGQNERGALYGTFKYLERLAQGNLANAVFASNPEASIRWLNQWDNLNEGGTHGSVERGYGGRSLFFDDGLVISNLTRAGQYARLAASIGINAIVVNNVNANAALMSTENIAGLGRIADVFRPYGIKLGLSLLFSAPRDYAGLPTFDPLDETVIKWWTDKTNEIYETIPDMAGYLIKANSEGQPGPLTYNRTLAEGANLFAKAVKPYDGVVMFRAFVYDHRNLNQTLDWRADRANAAVDHFDGLDGEFMDNVIIQIKYGPIDFQVREPASPLFSRLPNTNAAIELQITQEYLGQQCHLVYLPPMWREILDFDLRTDGKKSLVRDVVSGKRHNRKLGGYAGVANVGTNTTWLGSHLAMSNLYAYGRLAWDSTTDSKAAVQDWTRLTFGHDRTVLDTITDMSMKSWLTYEQYSGNLGIQTLTDILYAHYGPNPASQDGNPWGQWTRADSDSLGMDRTVWNGTRFSGQYPPEVARMYEKIETTPDNLVLWFHHVPYTHRLRSSGKTVIQHFYDEHYKGAATAQTFVKQWERLKGKIDSERYAEVLFRLVYQAGHSLVWRDSVCNFYFAKCGIRDVHGRVGNYRYRIEAETMTLDGYVPYTVKPFEAGSNRTAIVTSSNSTTGTASTTIGFPNGMYNLAVNYYDQAIGRSHWEVYINDKLIGKWEGNSEYVLGHAPSHYIDGQSAMRITFPKVKVMKGDKLKIVGHPDGDEPAPLDYVSLLPDGIVD